MITCMGQDLLQSEINLEVYLARLKKSDYLSQSRITVMHRGCESNRTDCPEVQKSIGHNVLNLGKQ